MLSFGTVVFLLAIWVGWLALLGYIITKTGWGRTTDQFLTAGRNVHWGLVTTSVVAAYIWSATLMASSEGAYTFGASGLWIYGLGYGSGLCAFGFGARYLRKIFPKATTVFQFSEIRFDKKTAIFWAILGIIFSYVTVMIQLIGAGIAIETFTGGRVPFWAGPTVVSIAVLLYVLGAGLWSSIVADFIMVAVAVAAAVWLAPWVITRAGGLDAIFAAFQQRVVAENASQMANFFRPDAMLNYLVPVLAWSWLTLWLQQEYWQKAFAADMRFIRRSYVTAGLWWAAIPITASTVGLSGWALGVKVNVASEIYPTMVAQYLPGWTQIVFLLMIFAAVTSTVASSYLAVSTVLVTNFYVGLFNPQVAADDQLLRRLTPRVVIAVAVVATILSWTKVSILQLLLFMSVLLAAPAPVILLGMLSPRLTSNGAFLASLVGMLLALYVYYGPKLGGAYILPASFSGLGWGIIVGALAGLVISLVAMALADAKFDFSKLREVAALGER